jgi:sialic acid synthase SpsE
MQLFLNDGINIPLYRDVFDYAYNYGNSVGYKVTSSVADLDSLKFLLRYDVPFVKIPNDRKLDWLIGEIPRKVPVYVSLFNADKAYWLLDIHQIGGAREFDKRLCCISKYPADKAEYENNFYWRDLKNGISDHTVGLELFKKYQPRIWEKHFCLSDSTGLDAGPFAVTPKQLEEIL